MSGISTVVLTAAAAIAVPAFSGVPVEAPPPIAAATLSDHGNFRVQITAYNNAQVRVEDLITTHRQSCVELGPEVCRIDKLTMPGGEYSATGQLRLRFASGHARSFIDNVTKAADRVSFDITATDAQQRDLNAAQIRLSQELANAQVQILERIVAGDDKALRSAALTKKGQLERELLSLNEQLQSAEAQFGEETVEIVYRDPRNSRSSFISRQWKEGLGLFGVFAAGAAGFAILTVLYLGIIGFAFLKMRRFAVRRGLIKGRDPA